MSDIKLFRLQGQVATEVKGTASHLEKPLQTLIEANLAALLGIRFLASEYSTGKKHGGRIDTLGLDENDCPVIIEYKRSTGENVINQGLYYLDWLMDHQAEFKLLVLEQFDKTTADAIDWASPRLVCIANDFTKYDAHAVEQIDWTIELIRYRRFGSDLLLFELVNATTPEPTSAKTKKASADTKVVIDLKPRPRWLPEMPPLQQEILQVLEHYILSLGDDVQRKNQKLYIAFKRLRNFATVVSWKSKLILYLHLDPSTIDLVPGFVRDVRGVGHWGTGDVEVTLLEKDDVARVSHLIEAAYNGGQVEAVEL